MVDACPHQTSEFLPVGLWRRLPALRDPQAQDVCLGSVLVRRAGNQCASVPEKLHPAERGCRNNKRPILACHHGPSCFEHDDYGSEHGDRRSEVIGFRGRVVNGSLYRVQFFPRRLGGRSTRKAATRRGSLRQRSRRSGGRKRRCRCCNCGCRARCVSHWVALEVRAPSRRTSPRSHTRGSRKVVPEIPARDTARTPQDSTELLPA